MTRKNFETPALHRKHQDLDVWMHRQVNGKYGNYGINLIIPIPPIPPIILIIPITPIPPTCFCDTLKELAVNPESLKHRPPYWNEFIRIQPKLSLLSSPLLINKKLSYKINT